jgi:hypothetical protein
VSLDFTEAESDSDFFERVIFSSIFEILGLKFLAS